VPACPFKCGAVSKRRALTALDAAQLPPSQRETFASKLDEVYLGAERAQRGAVQCIGKGCEEWYVPPVPHSDRPQRLECSRRACGAVFCSACRQPFHVRSTCAEALRLSARWVRFLQDELAPFLQAAVRLDGERWSPALAAHAQAKGSLDDATRDALSRFDELRRMELWKQAHCKRCPHCRRVVEKMEGCDMLVCGSDAHGGNQQRGCGKPFVWCEGQPNSALKYEADLRGAADYAAEEDGGGGAAGGGGGGEGGGGGATRERSTRCGRASRCVAAAATIRSWARGCSACSARCQWSCASSASRGRVEAAVGCSCTMVAPTRGSTSSAGCALS